MTPPMTCPMTCPMTWQGYCEEIARLEAQAEDYEVRLEDSCEAVEDLEQEARVITPGTPL